LSTNKRIGLTLSGGGIRAVVFHLGVLEWLARTPLWNSVSQISTVSGGSLAIGLLFARAGTIWPTADRMPAIIEEIKRVVCTTDLQRSFILNHLLRPHLIKNGRAALLADALVRCWGIDATLSNLPATPEWRINTTCYETGRNWVFSKREMGDYIVGYFDNPETKLQTALASSAAVPAAIGPMKVMLPDTEPRPMGYRKPPGAEALKNRKFITLWDGGVYENLGVERLFRVSEFIPEIDFLITSDASAPLAVKIGRWSFKPPFYQPMLRLADVATEQGRSYRVRALMNYLTKNSDKGAFIKIGNTPKYIFEQAKKDLPPKYTTELDSIIEKIWLLETTLRKLSKKEFSDLKLHGYETAQATFEAWVTSEIYSTAEK
jgi:NTE family protein